MSFKRSLGNSLYILGVCLILIGLNDIRSKKVEPTEVVQTPTPQKSTTLSVVERVYDGDTIQISTGEKIRYIGIDTTEVYPTIQCFSEEAKKANEDLVLGKEVGLEKDVSETDKYSRLLRYVYIGDVFVNDKLVRDGFAKVATYPPDVKYQQMFLESEKYARENNLGFWGKCSK